MAESAEDEGENRRKMVKLWRKGKAETGRYMSRATTICLPD